MRVYVCLCCSRPATSGRWRRAGIRANSARFSQRRLNNLPPAGLVALILSRLLPESQGKGVAEAPYRPVLRSSGRAQAAAARPQQS